jgi:hypothetical protein
MAMKKGSTQDELNKAFALKTEILHPSRLALILGKVDVLVSNMAMRMLR